VREPVDLGPCPGFVWSNELDRVCILLPGAHYRPIGPALFYPGRVAHANGWAVLEVEDELWEGDRVAWVEERVRAALRFAGDRRAAVVAKSVTSYAVLFVPDLPAVWMTPLLRDPEVVAALERATGPGLLVGGSADLQWDADVAARLPQEVLELDGADHALVRPGDPRGSVDLLSAVVERVDAFFGALGPG
jgi:hypothetical protein